MIFGLIAIIGALVVVKEAERRRVVEARVMAERAARREEARREEARRKEEEMKKGRSFVRSVESRNRGWQTWTTCKRVKARSKPKHGAQVVGVFASGQTVYSSSDRFRGRPDGNMLLVWDWDKETKGWVPISALR